MFCIKRKIKNSTLQRTVPYGLFGIPVCKTSLFLKQRKLGTRLLPAILVWGAKFEDNAMPISGARLPGVCCKHKLRKPLE